LNMDHRCNPWPALAAAVVLLASLALAGFARAKEAGELPSRISVLSVCAWPKVSKGERRLITELKLSLDGVDILAVDPGTGWFGDLDPQGQVEAIRERTRDAARTSPAVWLECDASGPLVARVLPPGGNAGAIRAVEGVSWEEIALLVRELVVSHPQARPDPQRAQRDQEREGEEHPEEEAPGKDDEIGWGVLTALELAGGLVGQEGSSFLAGLGLALELAFPSGFFGRAAFHAKFGPRDADREILVIGARVEPRIELGYRFELGAVELGPAIAVGPTWSSVDFAVAKGYHQRESWWSARLSCGAEAVWRLSERIGVVVDLNLGFAPNKRFYRRSTRETLLETPTMDMAGMVGLAVGI